MTTSTPTGVEAPVRDEGTEPAENDTSAIWAEHVAVLTARAIPIEFAIKHGLKSVDVGVLKAQLAKYKQESRYPHLPLYTGARGILIPYPNTALDGIPRCRIRVDRTEVTLPGPVDGARHGEKTVTIPRYICQARPVTVIPYVPPEVSRIAADTTMPIYIVEAPLKALSLTANGFPAIGLGGVLAGANDKEALDALGEVLISRDLAFIKWTGRVVYVVFDAGLADNPMVALGAARLALGLQREGADVRLVHLPYCHPADSDPNTGKFHFRADQGPDDFLATNGGEEFKKLVDAAVPADAIARVAIAAAGASRAEAVARLLGELPVQAMLHEGGAVLVDQVAAAAKAVGIGKRAIQQAAHAFGERLVRRAEAADSANGAWKSKLRKTDAGKVKNTMDNVLTILANDPAWAGVLAYNEFSDRVGLRKPAPWDTDDAPKLPYRPDQDVADADDVRLTSWLGRHYNMEITTNTAHGAICTTALRNTHHPVREYLRRIAWDGVKRLGYREHVGWLTTYLGVEDKRYTRIVGRMWTVSAVARIMQPGCLVKTMLVLCGPQDAKKSQAFATLGGDWYMDDLRDIHSKDACQQLSGKWIVEMGEMAAWSKADAETGKRFVSTKSDNYRSAYERRTRDVPRQSVFGGSSNPAAFLSDVTGGARFWPVDVGTINILALGEDRDQLWAEAVAAYDAGEQWWTEDEVEVTALREEQEARRKKHPWEDVLCVALAAGENETTDENYNVIKVHRPALTEVSMLFILDTILKIPVERRTRGDETTAGECLQALGWTRHRRRTGDGKDTREYFYRAPVAAVPTGPTVPASSPPPTRQTETSSAVFAVHSDHKVGRDGRDGGDSPSNQGVPPVPTSDAESLGGRDGRGGLAEPAPAIADSAADEPEWLAAGLAETWEDEAELPTGERVPRLNVKMFADDGRQLHAFHGGEARVQQMKEFYGSNPRMRVQVRLHPFGDGAGWLVVKCRADDSMIH